MTNNNGTIIVNNAIFFSIKHIYFQACFGKPFFSKKQPEKALNLYIFRYTEGNFLSVSWCFIVYNQVVSRESNNKTILKTKKGETDRASILKQWIYWRRSCPRLSKEQAALLVLMGSLGENIRKITLDLMIHISDWLYSPTKLEETSWQIFFALFLTLPPPESPEYKDRSTPKPYSYDERYRLTEYRVVRILQKTSTDPLVDNLHKPDGANQLLRIISSNNDMQIMLLLSSLLNRLENAYGMCEYRYNFDKNHRDDYKKYYEQTRLYYTFIKENFSEWIKTPAAKTYVNVYNSHDQVLRIAQNSLEVRYTPPHPSCRWFYHSMLISDGNRAQNRNGCAIS